MKRRVTWLFALAIVSFGGGDPLLFSERVLVTCAPLAPADRIQCHEAPAQ